MDAVQIHNIVPTEDKSGLKSNGLMLGQGMGLKERLLVPIMIIRGEIEMTQTIEQLQAKVAELEEENARLNKLAEKRKQQLSDFDDVIDDMGIAISCINPLEDLKRAITNIKEQLASAEEHNARLREALIATRDDLELRMRLTEDDSLNISNSVLDQMLDAIDTPTSREALDSYVAERIEQSGNASLAVRQMKEIASLRKQRDLAVEVLKTAYEVATNHDDRLPFDWAVYCEMLWQAIKESENN